METSILVFYVPFPNLQEAQRVGKVLIEKKVAACLNIYQATSVYTWQGDLCSESEHVAYIKTLPQFQEEVQALIEELHPYEVPCIGTMPMQVNKSYYEWIVEELRK
jgi:periplasmic divalent cation tolerance protein